MTPRRTGTDGFFVAVLKKRGDSRATVVPGRCEASNLRNCAPEMQIPGSPSTSRNDRSDKLVTIYLIDLSMPADA